MKQIIARIVCKDRSKFNYDFEYRDKSDGSDLKCKL